MTGLDISRTFVIWYMHHFISLVQYWASTLLPHRFVIASYFDGLSFIIDFHYVVYSCGLCETYIYKMNHHVVIFKRRCICKM